MSQISHVSRQDFDFQKRHDMCGSYAWFRSVMFLRVGGIHSLDAFGSDILRYMPIHP